ncbi:MAG: hypothetical protein NXI04_15930 [Planctomycetaceae bacterium]|nr:hypothetical protein [Planctomycetaceae bacterium]
MATDLARRVGLLEIADVANLDNVVEDLKDRMVAIADRSYRIAALRQRIDAFAEGRKDRHGDD